MMSLPDGGKTDRFGKGCLKENRLKLNWAGKEAMDMVISWAPGECPGESAIPSITRMFPKQTQQVS